MMPTLSYLEWWLFARGLHDRDARLGNVLHRQRDGLVTAICNDDQFYICLLRECVVNNVVVTATGACCLLCDYTISW